MKISMSRVRWLPSLMSALSVRRTFWPLMSRWITLFLCKWLKPWSMLIKQGKSKGQGERAREEEGGDLLEALPWIHRRSSPL